MNIFSKIYYSLLIGFSCFFFAVGALIIFLQTDFGKTKFEQIIQKQFASKGVHINFKEIKGFLPFQWTFNDLEVQYEDKTISASSISFRISFLKLFKNTLSLRSIKGSHISLNGFTSDEKASIKPVYLPFSIQLKSFQLNQVLLPNMIQPINLSGKLRIERNGKYLSSKVSVTRDFYQDSFVHLDIKAEKQRLVQIRLNGEAQQGEFFNFFYQDPIQGSFQFRAYAKGSWDSFEHLLFQNIQTPLKDISGNIYLQTENLSIQNTQLDPILTPLWEYRGDFTLSKENVLTLNPILITSDFATIQASLVMTHFHELQQANLTFKTGSLPIPLTKDMQGKAQIEKEDTKYVYTLNTTLNQLDIQSFSVQNIKGQLQGFYEKKNLSGDVILTSMFENSPLDASFSFEGFFDEQFNIKDLQVETKTFLANGALQVESDHEIEGTVHIKGQDTSFLKALFPHVDIDASFDGKMVLTKNQQATIDLELEDLHFFSSSASQAHVLITIENVFESFDIGVSAHLLNMRYFDYQFNTLTITSSFEGQNWPFEISATGCPLQFTSRGFWSYQQQEFNLNLQELFGFFYDIPYVLNNPTDLLIGAQETSLSDLQITMQNGSLKGSIELSKERSKIACNLQNFPLDLLSLNPLDLSVQGSINGVISLTQEQDTLNGSISLASSEVSLLALGEETPFVFRGSFHTSILNNLWNTESELFIEDQKIFDLDGSFFAQIHPILFRLSMDTTKKSKGSLFYDGAIEHIFDFLNFGANYIQGDLFCDLQWDGILENPKIEGTITWKDGVYENYTTGIYLENIEALIEGNDSSFILTSFDATDLDDGSLKAKGSMKLLYKESFPFSFHLKLDQIISVALPSVTGSASGDLLIQGSLQSAQAKGHLLVNDAEFIIPDKLPSSIPSIDVVYEQVPKQSEYTRFKKKYPLSLDILLDAPKNISVYGRGLMSEWEGQIRLEGLYNQLIAKGRLDLVKGDFNFSGHGFDLTNGELVFSGEANASPFLNLSARTNVQGFTITAKWTGPINEPNLEFSSLPPLPLSSILSYLLFGSDLSEITALQAVTLVSTAATLSGSPDILELTRRRLGLDRLTVVSSPTSEGEEDFSVQIGKYIADGVLVTFSQGMEQGTTNVIVNVDLKYGFMFQAETIQQQEQGRFSLLWNRNF